jgi:hypothetical protein
MAMEGRRTIAPECTARFSDMIGDRFVTTVVYTFIDIRMKYYNTNETIRMVYGTQQQYSTGSSDTLVFRRLTTYYVTYCVVTSCYPVLVTRQILLR